jgi:hypothetical protein
VFRPGVASDLRLTTFPTMMVGMVGVLAPLPGGARLFVRSDGGVSTVAAALRAGVIARSWSARGGTSPRMPRDSWLVAEE